MYHYLFTNDLRISVLDESLKKAGHCFATDTVPPSSVDKSANNNMMTLGFYFNLNKESNCARAAANGNTREVVLNFIKKFQFPNMRTTAAYNDAKADDIQLAPMRVIVKLLYTMYLLYGSAVAHLTKDEIKYFVFYNANVAKRRNPDIGSLITEILEFRKTGVYPSNVSTNESEHEWKHEERQIREMLKVLQWSGCIAEKEDQFVIDNDGLSDKNKAGVFDIITCTDFWEGSTIESYRKYMDIETAEFDDSALEDSSDNVNIEDDNEYSRAAKYLQQYVSESGFDMQCSRTDIQSALEEFQTKFAPDVLAALDDTNLLSTIFYTSGDNSDALCYWLEHKKEIRSLFGSIAGGSAYKFGLFQKQDTGVWMSGSSQKSIEMSDEDALTFGKQIRDALVNGVNIISNAELQTLADYEQLDTEIKATIGEQLYNMGWVHKYFAMICPDKLSGFHSSDWQNHVLRALRINPSDKYYARSGQLAMVENYAGWYYREFFSVVYDRFGGVKQFVRIGTSGDEHNYAEEWKQRSVAGIGWSAVDSLADYVAGDGLDKNALTEKLKEHYYTNDEKTASRKAGELIRFYKADESTVFVAMDGSRLIGFVDELGDYFFDATSPMAHLKPGKWHSVFGGDETLPEKTEGLRTSCYQLTKDVNLMFLYEKYYYGEENEADSSDDIDNEEANKRMFRYWMSLQVKPEGDSDAGQPYSSTSIDQYVSNIAHTPLSSMPDHSVFYTVDIGEVQMTIDYLDSTEKKNNTQRSAVRKYMQYLIATKEGIMPLNYRTNLETEYERNRIVFGAPGTGKSFKIKKDSESFLKGTKGSMERVTFHPDYTYAQFVGTYKPVSDGGSIRYEFVPGPFMRVFVEAIKSGRTEEPQPHILIIEEINRAKVAAVFGDVFQLLDRDDDGVSEYEIQTSEDIRKFLTKELGGKVEDYSRIRIPNNMFIWATMNSADQGVFPMDTAFKRRWNFEYLGINENESEIRGKLMLGTDTVQEDVEWNALRKAINEKLAKEYKVNEDKLMGPFFLSKKVLKTISEADDTIADTDRFIEVFKSKVIMYLYEDAAKQHKHKLFAGCEDTTKYSAVCDSFDKIGMQIFGEDFEEVYYNPQKG